LAGKDYEAAKADGTTAGEVWTDGDADIYTLESDGLFDTPRQVWLPVPDGFDPDETMVYYGLELDGEVSWVAGDAIEGWLGPDDYQVLELDGVVWFGFAAQHGGTVQLGLLPQTQVKPLQGSVLSLGMPMGDLLVLLLSLMLMAGFTQSRKRYLARPAKNQK
jgi:hypothetical protein